jgi:hypothetical protein
VRLLEEVVARTTVNRRLLVGIVAGGLLAGVTLHAGGAGSTTGAPPPVTPACSFYARADLEAVAGATLSDGVLNLNKRHVSGCAYAAPDPQAGPNIGILVTNRARNQKLFDQRVLETAFGVVERIPDLGRKAYFGIREKPGGAIDSLLLARDGSYGVQVAVTGTLDRQRVLDTAQQVASTVLQRLAVAP